MDKIKGQIILSESIEMYENTFRFIYVYVQLHSSNILSNLSEIKNRKKFNSLSLPRINDIYLYKEIIITK